MMVLDFVALQLEHIRKRDLGNLQFRMQDLWDDIQSMEQLAFSNRIKGDESVKLKAKLRNARMDYKDLEKIEAKLLKPGSLK